MERADVAIVGAGLAGLACALRLSASGLEATTLEASDRVGGRVRTDRAEGFLLDRGFQVLLTAYPEAGRVLDLDRLDLQPFLPGARVRVADRFVRVSDPLRRPRDLWATLRAPVGTTADKLRLLRLRAFLGRGSPEPEPRPGTERSTRARLEAEGFSDRFVDRFLRPFLGGIFLESDLETPESFFEFVFRMFSEGYAALPADGMEAIPRQLAGRLPAGAIRTGARVVRLVEGGVELADGERIGARAVVVAGSRSDAAALLPGLDRGRHRSTTCLYWSAPEPPETEPLLVLDGTGRGPVNNLCVPDRVSPAYAPGDRSLVSATVIGSRGGGPEALRTAARKQLREWYGSVVDAWEPLPACEIEEALPGGAPGLGAPAAPRTPRRPATYLAGDHMVQASIEGALRSGRAAAEAVLEDLGVEEAAAGS